MTRPVAEYCTRGAGEQAWVKITADGARLRSDPNAGRQLGPDEDFVDNVVAMAFGALTTPARQVPDASTSS